jgi:hypothetical protein
MRKGANQNNARNPLISLTLAAGFVTTSGAE